MGHGSPALHDHLALLQTCVHELEKGFGHCVLITPRLVLYRAPCCVCTQCNHFRLLMCLCRAIAGLETMMKSRIVLTLPTCFVLPCAVGKGGFAKCYRLIDTETNEEWACKVVAKASLTKQRHKAKVRNVGGFGFEEQEKAK